MHQIRVVTLNIWNRGEPWEKRLPLIRRGLEELAPDLVALQEVIRLGERGDADHFDQAALIADGLGYNVAFGRAKEAFYPFGNAILSRWPIAATRVYGLPHGGHDEHRNLLYTEIVAPFARIPFATTHLNWRAYDSKTRCRQARFIGDTLNVLCPLEEGFPPILAGDLNADPDADEIRFFRGHTPLGGESVYYADCFGIAGDGSKGATFCRANPYAAVCREPDRRIDYIFVRGPDDSGRGEPLESRLCFNEPDAEGVWPTDHYGVFARISA